MRQQTIIYSTSDFPSRIHGVCAYESASHFYEEIDRHLQEFGLTVASSEGTPPNSRDLIDLIDGYVTGYGQCTKCELGKFNSLHKQRKENHFFLHEQRSLKR